MLTTFLFFVVFFWRTGKTLPIFYMLGETPCFTQLLNINWSGLIMDDSHTLIILTEMSLCPWALVWSKVRIIFEILPDLILTVLNRLVVSNEKVNERVLSLDIGWHWLLKMSSLRYEKKSGPLPERISTVVPKFDATEGKLTYFKVSFLKTL